MESHGVSVEKTIDGKTFEIRLLDLDQAEATMVLLANMGGAALHGIGQDMQASRGKGWEAMAAAAASGAGGILTRLTAAQVKQLRTTFASSCSVKLAQGGGFEQLESAQHTLFRGRMELMLQWLAACVEVNFSGFFGELRARVTSAIEHAFKQGTESESTSPSV